MIYHFRHLRTGLSLVFVLSLVMLLALVTLLALKSSVLAADVSAEKMKQIKAGRGKAQLCTRCHGRLGMVHAISRHEFKGTVEAFVIKELVDFKTGNRTHEVMNSIARTLSDQDIQDVAVWYHHVSKPR